MTAKRLRLSEARDLVVRLLGPHNVGRLEYLLKPALRQSWGGAFNGQERRQELFRELLHALRPAAIVETGAHKGTTTRFLAEESGLPVFTVECDPRHHGFAALLLRRHAKQVELHLDDTRDFLRRLRRDQRLSQQQVLFYLDAHWIDVPLREELELIFTHWETAVAMVDDFEVPGTEYGFNDYGDGVALTMRYLAPLSGLGLQGFYPSARPDEETGARRGCVVLCRDRTIAGRLGRLPGLRRAGEGAGTG